MCTIVQNAWQQRAGLAYDGRHRNACHYAMFCSAVLAGVAVKCGMAKCSTRLQIDRRAPAAGSGWTNVPALCPVKSLDWQCEAQ